MRRAWVIIVLLIVASLAYAAETPLIGYTSDTVTSFGSKTSNANTNVAIQSAVSAKRVFAGTMTVANVGTATHTFSLVGTTGTVLLYFQLSGGTGFALDSTNTVQTALGEGLSFHIESSPAGASTDVIVTGAVVQK